MSCPYCGSVCKACKGSGGFLVPGDCPWCDEPCDCALDFEEIEGVFIGSRVQDDGAAWRRGIPR